eukprot:7261125-Pyramimonas_sp.AAC.1
MVFLPKGSDPRDRSDFVSRAPASTRPLSLANTDAKILSDAFCLGLNDVAPATVDVPQRGGVRG